MTNRHGRRCGTSGKIESTVTGIGERLKRGRKCPACLCVIFRLGSRRSILRSSPPRRPSQYSRAKLGLALFSFPDGALCLPSIALAALPR